MLIGLHGKAQSGKSTVAKRLVELHGFRELSFAAPIKKIAVDLFNMTQKQVNGDEKEVEDSRYGFTPRWLLQHLGTEVFRKLYPDIWVDYALRKYREAMESHERLLRLRKSDMQGSPCYVISDVRFRNEKARIEQEGGVVWKILRPDHGGASIGIEGHSSEHDLDSVPDSDYAAVLSAESGDVPGLLGQAEEALAEQRFIELQEKKV